MAKSGTNARHEAQRGWGCGRRPYADEALQLARALGDKAAESWSLQLQARVYMYSGDWDRLRVLADESLAAAEASGDPDCLRYSLFLLGNAALGQRRFDESAGFYTRCIALNREAGDSSNLLFATINFGQVKVETDALEAAEPMFLEAVTLARNTANRNAMVTALAARPTWRAFPATRRGQRACTARRARFRNARAE
jgi:tetratricopeptide (TPR) repeat protein